MMVTVSGVGFAGTEFTPSMRTAFPSFAESASCPLAPDDSEISVASENAPSPAILQRMRTSPGTGMMLLRTGRAPASTPAYQKFGPLRLRQPDATSRCSQPGCTGAWPRPNGAFRLAQVGAQKAAVDRWP